MRSVRLPILVVLLLLVTPLAADASGLLRGTVPVGEQAVRTSAPVAPYRWDPVAQIRDWTRWRVRLTIPLWIPGVTGAFASGSGDVEGPDGDFFDRLFEAEGSLSFALMGRIEVRYKRWGLNADGFAATITQNVSFTPRGGTRIASGDITGVLVRGDVNYGLGERWFSVGGRPTRLQLRAYAGVRSYNIHLTVNQVIGTNVREDVRGEWLDPIIGLRATWDVSRKFSIRLEGDVGGFGVGSEMAYWASGFLEWRFSRVFSVALGYSLLDFERNFTFAGEQFTWEATLGGPTLALTFKF